MRSIVYVGMDVHQDFIEVAGVGSKEMLFGFRVANNRELLRRKFRQVSKRYELRCCYEAGGCGYVVYRWLKQWGISCEVIASSLIPRKPGDRIKTDRRDALKLAVSYRAGILTPVYVPDEAKESARLLVRCREAIQQDVVRFRQRVLKFLQVKGLIYREGRNWTQKHWRYLRGLVFEGIEAVVYQEYLESLEYHLARLRDIDRQIGVLAKTAEYQESVARLRCLRGVDTLTAMVLLTEIIDFQRFANPRYLMSYLGLVPSQHSSGHSSKTGPITKTGNSRCRRILIESSWHYRHKPTVNQRLKEAWRGQPAALTAIAWKAQKRLHDKFWHIALGKDKQTAVVAVARELIGFIWAIMLPDHSKEQNF